MEINFNNVSFSYAKNKPVLNNINLNFNKSEIVFIMGHTGSGKTTLIQHINGLLKCDEGSVNVRFDNEFVLNKEIKTKNINDLRRNVGMVFQFPEYQLFEINVLKDVMFGPVNFFKDEEKAKKMAVESLHKMGICDEYFDKSPFDLSGGEKRKVAIAGVFASNPQVLIMDEPTSSLDPASSLEIMNLITSFKNEGKLVIIISHDTDLCYEYADRVILMNKGNIIKDGLVDDVFSDLNALEEASLVEPFVCKVKRIMHITDKNIRNVSSLKEVISCE